MAGDGIILLTQAARRAGRPTISLPASSAGPSARLSAASASRTSPEQVRFLTYGRGVDTTGCEPFFDSPRNTPHQKRSDAFVRSRRPTECRHLNESKPWKNSFVSIAHRKGKNG